MDHEHHQTSACQQSSRQCVVFLLLIFLTAPVWAQPNSERDKAIEHLRKVMEEPFLETGGFSEFDCSITSGNRPTQPFTCDAITAANKHYTYLLNPDPSKGLIVDLVTEPAGQLDYVWLPAMEAACQRFLEKFNQADWEAIYAGFEPGLQKLVPVSKIKADLAPVLELLGPLGDATLETYSVRDGGRNELQYSVAAENGKAVFRCGLHATENTMSILAYLVAPYPDTALYRSHAESIAVQQLTDLLESKVESVEIPHEQLTEFNAFATGVAILANGEEVEIGARRSGRTDDFSQYDYTVGVFGSPDS